MKRTGEASAKKPYQAPKLLVYGNLTEMTQASGAARATADGGLMMGMRKTA
jgi:hypothetical protein